VANGAQGLRSVSEGGLEADPGSLGERACAVMGRARQQGEGATRGPLCWAAEQERGSQRWASWASAVCWADARERNGPRGEGVSWALCRRGLGQLGCFAVGFGFSISYPLFYF
jgi:hypothetical protein